MVWKQDLAKLKAQLREEPAPPPKKVAPKPVDSPSLSMEEEDALFLAMMGRRPQASATPAAPPSERREPAPPPPPAASEGGPTGDFGAALASLKGMKRLEADPLLAAALAPSPQAPRPAPVPEPVGEASLEAAAPPPAPAEPLGVTESSGTEGARAGVPHRIQLAAGMAIEVDGALDLRGHSVQDALERIKDRVADAQYLHWRSLLVQLGAGPELHEGFLALVASGGLQGVTRFAQAPIPMGGAQAWVLYLLP